MSDEVILWRGTPIEDLSRDDLIKALRQSVRSRQRQKERDRDLRQALSGLPDPRSAEKHRRSLFHSLVGGIRW